MIDVFVAVEAELTLYCNRTGVDEYLLWSSFEENMDLLRIVRALNALASGRM